MLITDLETVSYGDFCELEIDGRLLFGEVDDVDYKNGRIIVDLDND